MFCKQGFKNAGTISAFDNRMRRGIDNDQYLRVIFLQPRQQQETKSPNESKLTC